MVKTFDLITYAEPAGFESTPADVGNHVSYRRVDPKSWILFSIYHNRALSKSIGAEFNFDWNDINAASRVAPPSTTARKVGARIDALEGGVYIADVGYVDMVEIEVRGHVIPIIIECGSVDQFHAYQSIIAPFLASLALTEATKTQSSTSTENVLGTTREVDYVEDGFVWKGANGLDYIPSLTTVASGTGFPGSIPGIWQDDRQQFTLELAADGTYASAYASSAASGSVRIREAGRWNADGTKLVLRPESASLFSSSRSGAHRETVKQEFGGPRAYDVTTLVLEYRRDNVVSRTDGIELKGPPAPWYYSMSGNFSIVLRRTGKRLK